MSQTSSAGDVSGSHYLRGQIARELSTALGAENVSTDPEALQAQAADWSWYSKFLQYKSLEQPSADFVARPGSTAEEIGRAHV